jgi:hypothetical protein
MSIPANNPLAYMGIKEKDPPELIKAQRAPTTADYRHDIGDIWINEVTGSSYQLVSKVAGVATWAVLGGSASDVNTLSGDTGGNLSPTAGNIALAGGRNIVTAGAGSTITVGIDTGTAAVPQNEFSATGNAFEVYTSTVGVVAGTTVRSIRGDLDVTTGNGTESPQAIRGNIVADTAADLEEIYGGYFYAQQSDGSAIDSNSIGCLAMTLINEANAVDQPQQWIAGSQSILSFDAGAAVPTAAIVCGSLSHVTYDAPMNTIAHGYVASRNGGGAGGTAGAAYKVIIGGGIDDWQYGLDLYTGSVANNYSTADIRLAQTNVIRSFDGFPTGIAPAGSVAIRVDGANADGVLYVNNDGAATSWRPVLRANTTWIERFTQSPIMQSSLDTGVAPTGATGDVNLMCLQGGEIMQQFIIGAGQTIIAPRMDAVGLLVSLDLTNTEGAEYNWGMTPVSKHAYTVGTSPDVAFIMSFQVADVTGANPILMGFRKQEANNGTYTAYTDYALIGLNNGVNPGTVIIEDCLNGGAAVQTNTTDAWADGENHTLRVNVTTGGVVTYSIDGAAPTATHAFTFDNGDVISPFFHFVHGAVAPGAIEWTDMVCGPQ